MAHLYVALLHYPVLDKNGQVVTTAVTNIDIHDIARSARTFGVRRFFVATPVAALRALSERILTHWESGFGSTYNESRREALQRVSITRDLDTVLVSVEHETGRPAVVVVTSARRDPDCVSFETLRRSLATAERPHVLVLGTGWGLAPEVMERADLRLEPILGTDSYNHLSVRAAAAVILDRLRRKG